MPLPREHAWFAAKTHGWGWGLPLRWQGWVVLVSYVGGIAAGTPWAHRDVVLFVGYTVLLSLILVWVCYLKGEPPRWRWGSRDR